MVRYWRIVTSYSITGTVTSPFRIPIHFKTKLQVLFTFYKSFLIAIQRVGRHIYPRTVHELYNQVVKLFYNKIIIAVLYLSFP